MRMEVAAIIQLFPSKTNIPATELNTKQLSSKWTSKHEIAVVQPSNWIKLKSTNTSGYELNTKQSRCWMNDRAKWTSEHGIVAISYKLIEKIGNCLRTMT